MTDKQMPERIYAAKSTLHKFWTENPANFGYVQYIRADLCEKTIEDKSASSLLLETLVEELAGAFKTALVYANCLPKDAALEMKQALSKLDAWRAG